MRDDQMDSNTSTYNNNQNRTQYSSTAVLTAMSCDVDDTKCNTNVDDYNYPGCNDCTKNMTPNVTDTKKVSSSSSSDHKSTLLNRRIHCLFAFQITIIFLLLVCNVVSYVSTNNNNIVLMIVSIMLHVLQIIILYNIYNSYRMYEHHTLQYRISTKKIIDFISNMFPEKLRQQLFDSNTNTNTNNYNNIPLLISPSPAATTLQLLSLSDTDDQWRVYNHNSAKPPRKITSKVSDNVTVHHNDVEVGNDICTTTTTATLTTLSMSPSDEITLNGMTSDTTTLNQRNNNNNHTITTTQSSTSGSSSSSSSSLCHGPIVELYPATTIMIADLAGFTAWSAYQEPIHVFLILETIFYNFDQIALQNQCIYKIETVGDCYVAVAGIPDPCIDHAVIMAQFAKDCITKFNTMIHELDAKFACTTNTTSSLSSSSSDDNTDDEPIPRIRDLGIRIGLNSGPITGGILRGERNRFQLFGDTINTAARMESNSCKGRVQVSETTAQLLFHANKHDWLIKRDDTIEAKGKGNLQTYWLK